MARTVVTYDAGAWDVAGVAPSSSPVTVTDAALSTSDITTNNVTTAKHGFTPKLPNDAAKYLDGTGAYTVPAGTSAVSSVFGRTGAVVAATNDYTEAQLSFSDITTNNVSTSKHGFAPKVPNDATKYLDGTGAYSVPAGTGTTVTTTMLSRAVQVGGSITLNSSAAYAEVAAATGGPGTGGLDLTIAAATSDVLDISAILTCANSTAVTVSFDIATRVSGASINWLGQSAGSNANNGIGEIVTGAPGTFSPRMLYTVQAGDITGGNVVLRLFYLSFSATNRVLARAVVAGPLFFGVTNLKH